MSNHGDWRDLAATGKPVYAMPNIFVCGPSGGGKSTSIRNLDSATTIVINTDRKALPFKGAAKFTKQVSRYSDQGKTSGQVRGVHWRGKHNAG